LLEQAGSLVQQSLQNVDFNNARVASLDNDVIQRARDAAAAIMRRFELAGLASTSGFPGNMNSMYMSLHRVPDSSASGKSELSDHALLS
jgi:hypothetical protein